MSALSSIKAGLVSPSTAKKKRTTPSSGEDYSSHVPAVLAGLPADSIQEWEAFDNRIKNASKSDLKELVLLSNSNNWMNINGKPSPNVDELKEIGGSAIGPSVRNILYKVLSNRVASMFLFHGARDKKAFKTTSFHLNVLPKVIRKHFKNATDKEIDEEAINWIRLAGQRKGGIYFKKWDCTGSSKATDPQRSPSKQNSRISSRASRGNKSPRKRIGGKSPRKYNLKSKDISCRSGFSTPKRGNWSVCSTPQKDNPNEDRHSRRGPLTTSPDASVPVTSKSKIRQPRELDSDEDDCVLVSRSPASVASYSRDEATGSEGDILS